MRGPFYAHPEGLISQEREGAGTLRERAMERASDRRLGTAQLAPRGQIAIVRHTGTNTDRVEDVCSQRAADALVMLGQK